MSSPWAEAEVRATLDFGNIDSELRARLERSVAIATRACEQHLKRLERTARQSAERVGQHWDKAADRAERAGARMESKLGKSFAATALDAQRSAARVADSYDQAFDRTANRARTLREQVNQALRGIDRAEVRLTIDARDALVNLRGVHRQMQAFLRANPLSVRIQVAENVAGAAAVEQRLERLARDRRSTVHVNTRGGGLGDNNAAIRGATQLASGVGRLGGAFGSLGGSVLSAIGTVGKFAGIAGAGVLAVGALVPAVAALASALVSVGIAGGGAAVAGLGAALVGVGALKAGLSGIGDALGAIGQSSGGGGGGAAAADNARQVEQAQKALTRAVRDEQKAQRDVATARKDAQEKLQDLHLEMRGATLSERDAVLSLKEAQSDLAKGGFEDANERDRAVLRVDEAEQRLLETRERNNDLAKETADADRKGIENSDDVVAAKEKLADATDAVKDARSALSDVQKGPAGGGGGGVDKLAEAMAKLSPNARDFVQTMIDLQPAWTSLQQSVQDGLFAGIGPQVRELAANYLPMLRGTLLTVVEGFNTGALSALNFVNSARGMSVVNQLLSQSGNIAGNFGEALGNLVPGFLAIGASAANVFSPLTDGVAAAASRMSESLVQAQESGRLDEMFQRALVVVRQLGDALGQVGSIIGGVFRAASAAGGGNGLANITNSLTAISEWVNGPAGQGALTSFFQAVGQAVSAILPIILSLAGIIGGQVAPMIAQLITTLGPVAEQLVGAFGLAIAALAPAIGPLASAIGSVMTAVAPLLPIIGQLIAQFVQMAGPILTTLVQALSPVLQALGPILGDALNAIMPALMTLAQALGPVFAQLPALIQPFVTVLETTAPLVAGIAEILGPILAQVLGALAPVLQTVAETFAQVLEAVSPLLPILGDALTQILAAVLPLIQQMAGMWSQMVIALLPLIPPLIQIVEALLPPLLQVVLAVLPLMFSMATAFINIVTAIAPLLVVVAQVIAGFAQLLGTIIGWGAQALGAVTGFIGSTVTFFSELPGKVIGFVTQLATDFVGVMTGLPGRVTTALGGLWNGLTSSFKTALNYLIGLWNNFSLGVDFTIPVINKRVNFSINTPDIPLFAQGGRVPMMSGAVRGRDSILAGIAPDEYIEPADKVNARTLPILDAIRAGWVPTPSQLSILLGTGALPGYVAGGLVSAPALADFAQGVEGAMYEWGGVHWGDCSGAVSAVANYASGRDAFGSRFATASEETELAARGFKPGLGPAGSLNIGWFNGGEYGGHTAATLPNGIHFEMGGARGDGQYGGQAAGADDPQFTDHAHLPPEHFQGLDPGSPTTGGGGIGSLAGPGGGGGGSLSGGGSSGGTSGGGAGGVGGSGGGGGGNIVQVEVINWPGGGVPGVGGDVPPASGAGAAIPPAATPAPGVGSPSLGAQTGAAAGSSSTMPFGQRRANAWAGEQNFGKQAQGWGVDAIKEVGGELLGPVGLDSVYGSVVDKVVEAIEKAQPPAAHVSVTDKTRGGVQVSGTTNTRTTYRGG